WITGVYDPATNQLFWPTGNPSPSNRGEGRAGDNLYSNTLLALNADTGKLNWHFQFTKHDEHDWDATQVPIMIDSGGKHLIAQANRNGFFYVVDRTNGKLLSANSYAKTTWSGGKDAEGRPVADKESSPTPEGTAVCRRWRRHCPRARCGRRQASLALANGRRSLRIAYGVRGGRPRVRGHRRRQFAVRVWPGVNALAHRCLISSITHGLPLDEG